MIMRMRNLSLLDSGHGFLKPWWTSPANWWVVSPTEYVWNVILRPSETRGIPGPQELEDWIVWWEYLLVVFRNWRVLLMRWLETFNGNELVRTWRITWGVFVIMKSPIGFELQILNIWCRFWQKLAPSRAVPLQSMLGYCVVCSLDWDWNLNIQCEFWQKSGLPRPMLGYCMVFSLKLPLEPVELRSPTLRREFWYLSKMQLMVRDVS